MFTKRLALRAPTSGDLPSLEKMIRDRRVTAYFPRVARRWKRMGAIARNRRAFREGKAYGYVIVERHTSMFIGTVSIMRIDREERTAELGYMITRPNWGKGYATEAARRLCKFALYPLKLRHLDANVTEGNAGSVAVLRKIGFRAEGSSRKAVWIRGRWRDLLKFGLLAKEFQAD